MAPTCWVLISIRRARAIIAPDEARDIIVRLPARSCNVALFVNEAKERISEFWLTARCPTGARVSRLQFHGEESRRCIAVAGASE